MGNSYYILKDRKPIPVSMIECGMWLDTTKDRYVAKDSREDITVSTVFLGIDHSYGVRANPQLFETMVFGGKHDQYQSRCSTWEEAEEHHRKACNMVGIIKE